MFRYLRIIALSLPAALAAAGCTPIEPIKNTVLSVPKLAKNGVVLDVMFVRAPAGHADLNEGVWKEIDELHFSAADRRRFESNGLRAGIISGPLPEPIERLLDLKEQPTESADAPQEVDIERRGAKQRQLRVRPGKRSEIIAMGEGDRVPEMSLLMKDDAGQVKGRTLTNVMGMFAARAYPQGDGGVKLELTPELEHGTAQKRFVPGDGMFRVEFGPPHEVLEELRIAAVLTPGQMLALTARPERVGSLGYRLFTEAQGDATTQKMIVIRLAHSEFDERFSDGPALAADDDGIKRLDIKAEVHETR
jgi:hypothetical protein